MSYDNAKQFRKDSDVARLETELEEMAEFKAIYKACNDEEKLLVLLMYAMAFRIESDALSAFEHIWGIYGEEICRFKNMG